MEVYATITQKVDVNPVSVIEKLIEEQLDYRNWIFEKNGKYYEGFFESAGSHSYESEEEITKEKYDYIMSLKAVLKYLKDKKK